jgi:hypothetical protein
MCQTTNVSRTAELDHGLCLSVDANTSEAAPGWSDTVLMREGAVDSR